MSRDPNIEARLEQLEKQVAELRRQVRGDNGANWIEQLSGSMKAYPEFDEVLRLGQAARRADAPGQ